MAPRATEKEFDMPGKTARLCVAIVVASAAGSAIGAAPAAADNVAQTITNDTPYELRLSSTTVTEVGEWGTSTYGTPAQRIPAGDSDTSGVYTHAAFHGVVEVLTYSVVDTRPNPDRTVGALLVRSGTTCTQSLVIKPACIITSAENKAYVSSNGVIHVTWDNDGFSGGGFVSRFHVREGRGRSTGAAPVTYREPTPDSGGDDEIAFPSVDWNVLPSIVNRTGDDMRQVTLWNSEFTVAHALLPPQIAPGDTGFSHWGNTTTGHGPELVTMYDLLDPRTSAWEGTIFARAGVRCTSILFVPLGKCGGSEGYAQAVTDNRGTIVGSVQQGGDPTDYKVVLTYTRTARGDRDRDDADD